VGGLGSLRISRKSTGWRELSEGEGGDDLMSMGMIQMNLGRATFQLGDRESKESFELYKREREG
jgi:hypothetical protein